MHLARGIDIFLDHFLVPDLLNKPGTSKSYPHCRAVHNLRNPHPNTGWALRFIGCGGPVQVALEVLQCIVLGFHQRHRVPYVIVRDKSSIPVGTFY